MAIKVEGIWGRLLTVVLALVILGALGTLGYVLTNLGAGEKFTEFYILGLEGKAMDYPEELLVGEEGKVLVGIINREQETAAYRVEVAVDGVTNTQSGTVTLEDGQKWEGIVGFTADRAGDNQKVEFLLYRQGRDGVYQELHLWVDIR